MQLSFFRYKFYMFIKKSYLNLENVLKKYQISVNNILNFEYVNSFLNESQNNLYKNVYVNK